MCKSGSGQKLKQKGLTLFQNLLVQLGRRVPVREVRVVGGHHVRLGCLEDFDSGLQVREERRACRSLSLEGSVPPCGAI